MIARLDVDCKCAKHRTRPAGPLRACPCVFFSSRRRHTRFSRDWSSDVCSSDLAGAAPGVRGLGRAGSAWRAQVFALDMALLSERAQPAEKFVYDAAELASHDQPVEHGGDRVR